MLWLALTLAALVTGWFVYEGAWDARLFSRERGHICANLNAAAAVQWLREHPETQVLDVRSAEEFAGGAVPGAMNVSMACADFDERVSALDRRKPVLVYCAGGYRSRRAVEKLKALGFVNIQHMHRGFLGWRLVAR